MAIFMISSVSERARRELAESLAKKLGWPCVSREELWEEARLLGIMVGRLEISIIRSRGREELLAREKDRYLACITSGLCNRAVDGNLVYHGISGHLLLPGVTHRIRVGLRVPRRVRLERAMVDLSVSRDKTLRYLEQLDEDLDRWARYVHKADPQHPDHFDLCVNTENLNIDNLATALCSLAELPDFRATPASRRLLRDQDLVARARLRLALDERTADADIGMVAEDQVLTVTYMPRQREVEDALPEVLEGLEGCRELDCTMAETSILLLQERHGAGQESLQQIMEFAPRWGAAVELLRWTPAELPSASEVAAHRRESEGGALGGQRRSSSGVYEERVEEAGEDSEQDDGGLSSALDALVAAGCSGGARSVTGTSDQLLEVIQQEPTHSLIVVGDVFLSKSGPARIREKRELVRAFQEQLKCPVITTAELHSRYRFGAVDAVRVVGFSMVILAVYATVFLLQDRILWALGGNHSTVWRAAMAVLVALLVPAVAFSYSRVTGTLLKLVGIA